MQSKIQTCHSHQTLFPQRLRWIWGSKLTQMEEPAAVHGPSSDPRERPNRQKRTLPLQSRGTRAQEWSFTFAVISSPTPNWDSPAGTGYR